METGTNQLSRFAGLLPVRSTVGAKRPRDLLFTCRVGL